jgi:hypothetical protein
MFKCHWFNPRLTKWSPNIGQVEIRQDSVYQGKDVFIVAHQAVQVYYLPYACQGNKVLKGWAIVHQVSPHGRLVVPNDEDYNFNPNTYDGEFYQEDGIQGRLVIDLTEAIIMKVDNERVNDEEEGDEVQNAKDIEMLERLHIEMTMKATMNLPTVLFIWTILIVMTRHIIQIIPIMMITSNTCNTMLFPNRVLFIYLASISNTCNNMFVCFFLIVGD